MEVQGEMSAFEAAAILIHHPSYVQLQVLVCFFIPEQNVLLHCNLHWDRTDTTLQELDDSF